MAWCNGASGIAGALAITGHLAHYPGLVDTYLSATQAKTAEPASDDDQVGIDVSLCHGLAGTLSTLQLLRDFGYADPKAVDKFHAYVEHIALTAPICFGYPIEFYNSRTNGRINSATNKLNNSQSQQPIALYIYLWIEAFLFSPWVIMRQYLMVGITLFAHHGRANLKIGRAHV